MYMEIRNSKTEMPLFKIKGEKFIFVGEVDAVYKIKKYK